MTEKAPLSEQERLALHGFLVFCAAVCGGPVLWFLFGQLLGSLDIYFAGDSLLAWAVFYLAGVVATGFYCLYRLLAARLTPPAGESRDE